MVEHSMANDNVHYLVYYYVCTRRSLYMNIMCVHTYGVPYK